MKNIKEGDTIKYGILSYRIPIILLTVSLLYKAILSVCMYVRGLFAPTGHIFQDTDIWFYSYDPKFLGAEALP